MSSEQCSGAWVYLTPEQAEAWFSLRSAIRAAATAFGVDEDLDEDEFEDYYFNEDYDA